MVYLNKNLADTLCTIITLGYIAEEVCNLPIPTTSPTIDKLRQGSSVKNKKIHLPVTTIQYKKDDDKEKIIYEKVQKLFHRFGVDFEISPSVSQEKMAYVIAKNHQFGLDTFRQMTAEDGSYFESISQAVAEMRKAPRGAYIGGKNDLEGIDIIGPSKLEFGTPQYRDIQPAEAEEIKKAYDAAKKDTNTAINCLSPNWVIPTMSISEKRKRKVTLNNLIPLITEEMDVSKKLIFKSYHGMIQAMITHQAALCNDKNTFFFEIALGPNTTKVSSCIPCSMFMTSVGMPPISTHLGRGDNWNIPQINPRDFATNIQTKSWYSNIISYYLFGMHQLETQKKDWYSALSEKMAELEDFMHERTLNDIPMAFLEALTFEDSFTTRIINTLN